MSEVYDLLARAVIVALAALLVVVFVLVFNWLWPWYHVPVTPGTFVLMMLCSYGGIALGAIGSIDREG